MSILRLVVNPVLDSCLFFVFVVSPVLDLRRSPVSGRAVLCDRGVDESIGALVLAVAEEATKNKATTTVFVFVLVLRFA